ncbi:hypothetical protein GSI_02420 [Ganoderma sinense ZZ0214-1]|uniref:CWH43-like N-terminal domain-containing protein n=1 Tax=Ganoderma sinense ZZ0214-1 TaxID=1077348 RepID=A0A2G8SPK7_9APHY|nr:hypothetical protein GSI_02420 [Ganoderma sinense ZZ0214-1]
MTGSIAYISDIGAEGLKPLFITGCSITAACFVMSLVVERWLRYRGRLVPTMRRRERILSTLAILGSVIGGAGLILLSIFDTKRHHSLHRTFLLVFILGVALSAIFTIAEFHFISRDFEEIRRLRYAYIVKGVIVAVLILLAIAFTVALYTASNAGAVLEWIIAFGFTFYLVTFIWDIRMAKGIQAGELRRERLLAVREEGQGDQVMREASVAARRVISKLLPKRPPGNATGSGGFSQIVNGNAGQERSEDDAPVGGVTFPQSTYLPPGHV